MKRINRIDSVKELCSEACTEILKFTKAHACWIYLSASDVNSVTVKKIHYALPEKTPDKIKKMIEDIFLLGEDLFSNNYDMEDTLDYFDKLSKDNIIIEPVIVKDSLCGYMAVVGKRNDFNFKNKTLFEMIVDVSSSALEIISLRDDLEKQDKEKIQFLASISHEYKTPLNSMIGFSDMLKINLSGTENYKYIDNISKSAKFLLSLIQDILDMARSQFEDMELYCENFQPKEVIEDIVYSFQEIVNSKNLHFSYTMMDVEIKADLRRFKQVIYNLISNAVKFNKLNGKITIVSYINEKNEFVFEIKDTGDGIRKKDFDKIFNFFSQVNQSHLKRQQGSGIGLALCKKIVEAHGGTIDFKSRLNSGSTFWFTIPQEGVEHDGECELVEF